MRKLHLSSSSQIKIARSLITLGLIAGLIAGLLLVHNNQKTPKAPPGALTSKSAPSSVKPKPKTIVTYSVPPTDPKYIAIPAIGIANTPILKLGLINDAIAVPDNIYETGWYDASSKPGQPGAMFIYGHVSSWTADGIFYNLKKLQPSDTITITTGANEIFTYRVVSTKIYQYNNVDMQQVLSPINTNLPGLNLMTCTGRVIKGTSEFNERLVVFTSLINS